VKVRVALVRKKTSGDEGERRMEGEGRQMEEREKTKKGKATKKEGREGGREGDKRLTVQRLLELHDHGRR
jgi:hypothetical protein